MSATVAKKKKKVQEDVLRLRCSADWLDRVDEHAERLGLSRSAFIRLRLTEVMDEEDRRRGERQSQGG